MRLASAMWDYSCFSIEITRTYDSAAFHDDLKRFMFTAGCKNKPAVFLFSDTQVYSTNIHKPLQAVTDAHGIDHSHGVGANSAQPHNRSQRLFSL